MADTTENGNLDVQVDTAIFGCLDLEKPRSFFLFAGAGSGKTRSLVTALLKVRSEYGQTLRINRKKIAVITYTNAACDEIKHRIDYDPLFMVSTIHSFVWDLIKNYQHDMREWLRIDLTNDIAELKSQLATGRPGTKIALDRQAKIDQKTNRLGYLDAIRTFTYSPTGDNRTKDSLNHSEVVRIAADFLLKKPLMQKILIQQYPILFIDESQDTKKELIDAFFEVQKNHSTSFSLGLFGDTMQRIYSDGKEGLGKNLPADWITPAKKFNHRCPKRVIKLINQIRSGADGQTQEPGKNQDDGFVRLFITPRTGDKITIEAQIAKVMASVTGDDLWTGDDAQIKILILEHHMAARRLGFLDLFEALTEADSLRTGILDGSLSGLRFFTQIILPLQVALKSNDKFTTARIVKQFSNLVDSETLKSSKDKMVPLKLADDATKALGALWENGTIPTLEQIILSIHQSNLFSLPESLYIIASRLAKQKLVSNTEASATERNEERDIVIESWEKALKCPFTQIEMYNEYISDTSKFGTHQGVKGREFPRVMVILDDEEASGFLFSYDKLFGAKAPTATDLKNIAENKETSNDRTLRLFYVSCSRAEKSLVIIVYTDSPEAVKDHAVKQKWFLPEEIIVL